RGPRKALDDHDVGIDDGAVVEADLADAALGDDVAADIRALALITNGSNEGIRIESGKGKAAGPAGEDPFADVVVKLVFGGVYGSGNPVKSALGMLPVGVDGEALDLAGHHEVAHASGS